MSTQDLVPALLSQPSLTNANDYADAFTKRTLPLGGYFCTKRKLNNPNDLLVSLWKLATDPLIPRSGDATKVEGVIGKMNNALVAGAILWTHGGMSKTQRLGADYGTSPSASSEQNVTKSACRVRFSAVSLPLSTWRNGIDASDKAIYRIVTVRCGRLLESGDSSVDSNSTVLMCIEDHAHKNRDLLVGCFANPHTLPTYCSGGELSNPDSDKVATVGRPQVHANEWVTPLGWLFFPCPKQ